MIINKSVFLERFLSLCFFCISPFISSLYFFYNMVIRRDFYFNTFLFCLFLGLIGYTFNATPQTEFDLMRVYNNFDIIKGITFNDALPLFVLNGDLSLATLWVISLFTKNAQFVGMFSFFLLYYSIIIVIDRWYTLTKLRDNYKLYFITLILVFSMIHPLFWSGVRNSIAFSLLILSVIFYFENKNLKSNVLLVLSVLNHFSILPIAVIFLFFRKSKEKVIVYLSLAMIVMAFWYNSIMTFLLNILEKSSLIGMILAGKIRYYVFGDLTTTDVKITTGSRIWLFQIVLFILIFIFTLYDKKARRIVDDIFILKKMKLLLVLFLSLLVMNISNVTLLGRYMWFFVVFGTVYLVTILKFMESIYTNRVVVFCLYFSVAIFLFAFLKEFQSIEVYKIAFANVMKVFYGNLFQIFSIVVNYKV